jgi:ATPase subunit of ABC transporter with duplicated ATPase domains
MSMILLQGLGLAYPHKTCLADASASIDWGQRIAIVGDNGAGKSSLLCTLAGVQQPTEGRIVASTALRIGHVAQVLDDDSTLSGGQRVNRALSRALAGAPELLLLDEPTNHLDADNRRALERMLRDYYGALVLVTHDAALMDALCDTLWLLDRGQLHVFDGRYADYLAEQALQREALVRQRNALQQARHDAHDALMQEQQRAAHARQRGIKAIEQNRWATIKSPTKLGRGNTTAGRKQADIRRNQEAVVAQLAELGRDEVIVPRFNLPHAVKSQAVVLQVSGGSVGYDGWLVRDLHLSLAPGARAALCGANGSGKSTVLRAVLGQRPPLLAGDWIVPPRRDIGYLDQHYADLDPADTVLGALSRLVPDWPTLQMRRHLADFLFRHDATVATPVACLSGGERARLALACLAACPPRLLLLDEPTNNLDRRTRQHLVDVLRGYPGAMLVVSHDADFLAQIGIVQFHPLERPMAMADIVGR